MPNYNSERCVWYSIKIINRGILSPPDFRIWFKSSFKTAAHSKFLFSLFYPSLWSSRGKLPDACTIQFCHTKSGTTEMRFLISVVNLQHIGNHRKFIFHSFFANCEITFFVRRRFPVLFFFFFSFGARQCFAMRQNWTALKKKTIQHPIALQLVYHFFFLPRRWFNLVGYMYIHRLWWLWLHVELWLAGAFADIRQFNDCLATNERRQFWMHVLAIHVQHLSYDDIFINIIMVRKCCHYECDCVFILLI